MARKIGIVGLGLIGGSLAKAFKRNNQENLIYAYDVNSQALTMAKKDGVIDFCSNEDYAIFESCEIVFVCTPCDKTVEAINNVYSIVGADALITDVASVKRKIVLNLPKGIRFIGGHPMAGVEKGGYRSAVAYLFENAYYVLTPSAETTKEDLKLIKSIIKNEIKAISICVDMKEHDEVVSKISHLPHIVAFALCNSSINTDLARKLAAGGFKDITRVASSDSKIWKSIAFMNMDNVVKDIDNLTEQLNLVKTMLLSSRDNHFEKYVENAKEKRDSLNNMSVNAFDKAFELVVNVEDKIGEISKVTALLAKNNINILNMFIENSREGISGVLKIRFADNNNLLSAKKLLFDKYYLTSEKQINLEKNKH